MFNYVYKQRKETPASYFSALLVFYLSPSLESLKSRNVFHLFIHITKKIYIHFRGICFANYQCACFFFRVLFVFMCCTFFCL